MAIKTLKDIERERQEGWETNCDKEVSAQILLNYIKKKKLLNKYKIREIQKAINILGKDNLTKFTERRHSSQA